MYRKMFSGMICLMLFGGTFFVPKGRADESDRKTIVTVNQPIQVPGKVLPAGTYVFKLPDSNDLTLVAIFKDDESHLITTVQGISDVRMETPDKAILQIEDPPSGHPQALNPCSSPVHNPAFQF